MPNGTDVVYTYDGSYEGFLCCVYDSYYQRENPLHIFGPDACQLILCEQREIETDPQKAARVAAAIEQKISSDATQLLTLAFLSILEDRERHMLDFIRLGFSVGVKAIHMLADSRVDILTKAVRHLTTEAYRFIQFVRFSEVDGVLAATISPKNRVLPLLADHFSERFPDEYIIIYDQTHQEALIMGRTEREIIPLETFTLPQPGEGEAMYRRLWRGFYDTIAVEGRINPQGRMNMMPKWYWKNMTELMDRQENHTLSPPSTAAALSETKTFSSLPPK